MRNKLKIIYLVLAFLFVCGLVGLPAWPASAQTVTPVTVGIIPEQVQAAVGQTFDVAVEVNNVSDLYAIDVLVAYDPQAVEVIDQDPELDGLQVKLGTLLEPGFVIFNLADNSLGRLRMVMTQLNPATPKSGTGTLVVITFKAKAPSPAAPVEVLAARLANPTGQEIPVESLGKASLEILANVPGPTSTPIPAQDPGTPMPTPAPPTQPAGQASPDFVPTFTPTLALFNPPPTAAATQPLPTAVPPSSTPTETSIPAAPVTSTPVPAANPVAQNTPVVEPSEDNQAEASQTAGLEITAEAPEQLTAEVQASEDSGRNFTWIWLLLAAILVGGGIYFYLRSRKRN